MAVTILKYPGGLEYPDVWKNSITGLTPISSYTLTKDQALSKFPGLAYDSAFKALPDDSTNNSMTPQQQQLHKAVDDAKANWDSKPSGTQESFEAYKQYQSAVKALSDWSVSTLSSSGASSISPATSSYPETKAQPIVEQEDSVITEEKQTQPTENFQSPDKTIAEFENKLLDQAKGEAVDWSSSASSPSSLPQELAQADTSKWPSILDPPKGPPPVVAPWNKGMPSVPGGSQEFQYKPGAGTYPMVTGPRGESLIAEVKYGMGAPKVPAWMKLIDDDYKKNINKPINQGPIKNSGRGALDTWEGPSGYGASVDSKLEAAIAQATVAPEEQKGLATFQSEYDPQKAKLASAAAKQYKTGSATEDPFKSSVFG